MVRAYRYEYTSIQEVIQMVELKLTDSQAKIVSRACEFYARIVLGQFKEILFELMNDKTVDSILENRDQIELLLYEARDLIYPELHGFGHSYGLGKFEHADRAYDVYQVIRTLFGDTRESFSYYDLPEARRYKDPKEEN